MLVAKAAIARAIAGYSGVKHVVERSAYKHTGQLAGYHMLAASKTLPKGCVVRADEAGLPFLGMAPYILKNGLDLTPLHPTHGERFWINTGPLFGKCLALQRTDDLRYVLEEGRPFDFTFPGARVLSAASCHAFNDRGGGVTVLVSPVTKTSASIVCDTSHILLHCRQHLAHSAGTRRLAAPRAGQAMARSAERSDEAADCHALAAALHGRPVSGATLWMRGDTSCCSMHRWRHDTVSNLHDLNRKLILQTGDRALQSMHSRLKAASGRSCLCFCRSECAAWQQVPRCLRTSRFGGLLTLSHSAPHLVTLCRRKKWTG